MAEAYNLKFEWPQGPSDVMVTGTFDNWSCSTRLKVNPTGSLEAIVPVPWETKIFYKFVVDGTWMPNPELPTEYDASGNLNNAVTTPRKPLPQPGTPTIEFIEDVAPITDSDEDALLPAPVAEEVKLEAPQKAAEVASRIPIAFQPVLDASHDSTPKEAVNSEASTHLPLPPASPVSLNTAPKPAEESIEVPAEAEVPVKITAEEPTPETSSDKFLEAVLAASGTSGPVSESETPVRPTTPPPKKTEEAKAEETPVSPVKTNSAHAGSPTTTSGLSTPPSSSAPSTPKTQSAFIVEGKLKKVFKTPEKDKNKKRLGSETPTHNEKVKA
ncbi:carbohydrate-binding module family 48 [Pyrrhoderma noxium]|uniref:Carbohydrate-binding module family 48 n=1 Tax=Pyrrhoderma noxium TaxID=2282107 RepID=A0A286UNH7_9AGAM|nr:carbohydrate-binding module family 48 [Pyrrhoderma noxium]